MPGVSLIVHPTHSVAVREQAVEETRQAFRMDVDIRKDKFISVYVEIGTISGACNGSNTRRSEFLRWLKADPVFRDRFKEAQVEVVESLEEVAIRRAKASSDYLLVRLLEANKPAKYRPGANVKHTVETKQQWKVGDRIIEF